MIQRALTPESTKQRKYFQREISLLLIWDGRSHITVELEVIMLVIFKTKDRFLLSQFYLKNWRDTNLHVLCFCDGEDPAKVSAGKASFRGALVSERCQTGCLQSRNADCKKVTVLNRLFGEERNSRRMVCLLLTRRFLLCRYWVSILACRKHFYCKAEALSRRDFGSNRSRASAKMLIYSSNLAKPLEVLSLLSFSGVRVPHSII